MYMVLFLEKGQPQLLGRYDDKGAARRAWGPCKPREKTWSGISWGI
jgi:hypothetical protein